MEFKNYYEILGVQESALADDIKKAYRKMARKYHPDVSHEDNAEERFKEVTEAYEVLKDPQKRAEYDQLRSMGAQGADGSFRPPPGWESAAHFNGGGYTEADAAAFSDFFEQIFGRHGDAHRTYRSGRQSSFRMRGEDVHQRLGLFLEEVYNGCEKTVRFSVPVVDEQGLVSHQTRTLKIAIPAGLGPGQHLRLRGQGAPGIGGGEAGDLLIEVQLAPHPVYRVEGRDLFMNLPVAPWEAALGATVEVATLAGKVKLKVPAASQSGTRLRLKGKGLPGKSPGDLIIELRIVMPPKQTERSRELFEALASELSFDPRSDLKG